MIKPNSETNHKVKLVYYDLEDNIATENVWAIKEGEYYKLKNVPFFAPNLAYDDLISVENDDGELFFDSLIEPSGHSTIQVIFFDMTFFSQVTADIIKFGCAWEGSHLKEYISVDIPKMVDYSKIKDYFNKKREEKILDYQEACLSVNHN